jgi:hypothetical protein
MTGWLQMFHLFRPFHHYHHCHRLQKYLRLNMKTLEQFRALRENPLQVHRPPLWLAPDVPPVPPIPPLSPLPPVTEIFTLEYENP